MARATASRSASISSRTMLATMQAGRRAKSAAESAASALQECAISSCTISFECCDFLQRRRTSARCAHVITLDGMPAGLDRRHRRAQRAAPATPGRLRPRPADGHRERPRGDSRRRPPRPHDRRADCDAHSQSRLGQLAADDVCRARDAGGRVRNQAARTSPGRVPGTRTLPAPSNTATRTSATCSSAPARARRRRASPPGRLARQLLGQLRHPHRQPRVVDRRRRAPRVALGVVRRGARDRRGCAASMRGRRCFSRR